MSDPLSPERLQKIDVYWRASNYLAIGQIYLRENPLLEAPLKVAPDLTVFEARRLAPKVARRVALGRHSFSVRRRRALTITDTELSDMASAATTGLRRMPKVGWRTPAAIGIPIPL